MKSSPLLDRYRTVIADLDRLAGLGVAEVLISFDAVEADEILRVLDRYAKAIART
jgi:hypothetical protein